MIYRSEHPKPQWERKDWRCLNGEWEFDFDFGRTARELERYKDESLPKKINIPFSPESDLSGIGYKDFMPAVCYRKKVEFSKNDLSKNIILHFGAIDFRSYIYINEQQVAMHIGGFSSFSVDITDNVKEGENVIFVIAEDDVRSMEQPCGKQSDRAKSYGCYYTRTTGIWQTVWIELIPKNYIKRAKYYPDPANGAVTIMGEVSGCGKLDVSAYYEGRIVGKACVETKNTFSIYLKLDEKHLWEPGIGRLYDLEFTFGEDEVKSYFGLRSVAVDGKKFTINSDCVFQRFVLDQGFYPEGIMTAKDDEELKRDIELSMAAGFNGARLHQKIFEERFLYFCDKAGYMVWEEHPNWGMEYTNIFAVENFMCEWMEVIERDFNHPSIIGWCPINETWKYYESGSKHRFIESVYNITKKMDYTRPCIAVSGNYHIENMEIHDVHDYCSDIDEFKESYAHIDEGIVNDQIRRREGDIQKYKGQAVFVSEYGGFALLNGEEDGWGYGVAPKTKDELLGKYKVFTETLLDNPHIMGFCYTQLYDIEQEKNGLYTYWRQPKLDMNAINIINSQKARIETE